MSPRGSYRGRPTQRRRTGWEQGIGNVGLQAQISGSSSSLVNAGVSFVLDGITIARQRGSLLLALTDATAAVNGFTGAFGIGMVSTAAFTAGAASVPTPITEQEWEIIQHA